ncbi:hypothetical protein M405DRAFT_833070 [Rhizopogon salebrosus TDB-379]|nr:hypothetical protein M405DRAFT_833070 [Rhizopogon salebrosus TDB-379]
MSTHLTDCRACTSLTSLTNDKCMLHHSSIIGQGSSDKDLLRSLSQALLECLDRHDHHDRLNSAIEGATRICPAEILVKCQPEIALMDEDSWRYGNVDLQGISVVKSHTPPSQEYGILLQESVGVDGTLPERTDHHLDFFHFGTSGLVIQQFHSSAPQHSTYSEAQTLSCPSTTRQPHLPVAQGIQEKVECTWHGCSGVVRKDSYTRHVNETHLRKFKAVCARCERTFPRMYLKKNHEHTCRD